MKRYGHHFSNQNEAKQTYKKAETIRGHMNLKYLAIAQHNEPHYRNAKFNNLSGSTTEAFKDLPNYQELFGTEDF